MDKSKLEFLQHNWDKMHLNARSNKHHWDPTELSKWYD